MSKLEQLHLAPTGKPRSPPLLFIHGGFHGAWCWADHFMPWFAQRGFACHAISYRDHGASPRTGRDQEWRLADYVADVACAADRLDQRPILVGHSLGGSIAQKLAAQGDFSGMILLAPSPIGGSTLAALRMLGTHPLAMTRAMASKDMRHALPAFLSFFLSPQAPQSLRDSIAKRCTGLTSINAANDAFYRDTPAPCLLGIPVLVASGKNDWSIPQGKNERLAIAYGGDHIVVPTAHDIMCDLGWEKAAAQLLDWLNARFPA